MPENMITLYTTDCPKCRILKQRLDEKKISYAVSTDIDEMQNLGIQTAPYLKVGETLFDFTQALVWVGELAEDFECDTCVVEGGGK